MAGETVTVPIVKLDGTSFRVADSRTQGPAPLGCSGAVWRADPALSLSKGVPAPHVLELSQNFFTVLILPAVSKRSPRQSEGSISDLIRTNP